MTELFLLALALAMDACAVALVRGAVGGGRLSGALVTALAFGIAQGVMPLLGWALGQTFAAQIAWIDHWIAFVLLAALGLRMIYEARASPEEARPAGRGSAVFALFAASLATSIDAAVAGITLDNFAVSPLLACVLIGAVSAVLCFAAYLAGTRAPRRTGSAAELFGGVVLIALGTKILVEHLSS